MTTHVTWRRHSRRLRQPARRTCSVINPPHSRGSREGTPRDHMRPLLSPPFLVAPSRTSPIGTRRARLRRATCGFWDARYGRLGLPRLEREELLSCDADHDFVVVLTMGEDRPSYPPLDLKAESLVEADRAGVERVDRPIALPVPGRVRSWSGSSSLTTPTGAWWQSVGVTSTGWGSRCS